MVDKKAHLQAEEHSHQVFEERNRAFRVLFDTVMEVEGASDEDIFAILCRNLIKLCEGKAAAFASYDPVKGTMTLECACRQPSPGEPSLIEQPGISVTVKGKTVAAFREKQVQQCDPHRDCLVDIFSETALDEFHLEEERNCYRLSCVRGGELIAGGMVQLAPGSRLKMKDMVDTYLNLAGLIIQRIQINRSLQESEERYRGVVEDQTEFVCRFGPDLKITFLNRALCKLTGQTAEELFGKPIIQFIEKSQHSAFLKQLQALSPASPTMSMEQTAILPDGTRRWIQWVNRAIFDDKGNLIEYQGVGRDITDRQRAQEALQESEIRLKLLLRFDAARDTPDRCRNSPDRRHQFQRRPDDRTSPG